jgi:addiction module HigA family antidote
MSQANFAKRLGVHDSKIHNVIYQHRRIDMELAKRFEAVLGISATTWLRLQEEGQ